MPLPLRSGATRHPPRPVRSRALTALPAATQGLHPEVDHTQNYNCPICLQQLQAPVVLNCSHSFCWGCITMYCLGKLQEAVAVSACSKEGDGTTTDGADVAPAKMAMLHQGWAPMTASAYSGDGEAVGRFQCPVCRKLQTLDLDTLNVDENLHAFVSQLARRRSVESNSTSSTRALSTTASSTALALPGPAPTDADDLPTAPADTVTTAADTAAAARGAAAEVAPAADVAPAQASPGAAALLLQLQSPRWRNKLTVVLDLDGTLIASFPPRRAPALPRSMRTHLVGQGSSLNPQGTRPRPKLAFGERPLFHE
jgi:carboxy-terminal domain RNA polymerase II polypeptide A small phosphatase